MNWFKWIVDAIITAVSINDKLFVRMIPCTCKGRGKLAKNKWGRWYVYCPYGCRRRAQDEKTRRRAKLTWNAEMGAK